MNEVSFERVRELFVRIRDLDEAGRQEVLSRECDGDATLRDEIESLLAHHDDDRSDMTTPAVAAALHRLLDRKAFVEPALPRPFGAFELQEVIGRGGMGTVYRARQRTPDRVVALKIIRPGMMSSAMLERFRYEADVLGRLQHPGIAQIFEAGTVRVDDADQPYFAMELVAGQPIDIFVREDELDVRERIELLAKVCDAVHHAHQKGVIHRDLKPGNILVDQQRRPKVLDFGVARAVDADVRATTLQTAAGQLIGTLPYMSPEQLSGDRQRLDVRSDVYALGVLIFEVLTGRLPHELDDQAITTAAITISTARPARLSELVPDLRGDLETITGKALEKEPSRRYESAAALADDLRRYLAHQPIVARPPSMVYQVSLFARRHRALVAGGTLAVAALLLATVISSVAAVHANRSAERESRQRQIAERTSMHLENMLMLPDPHERGASVTVAEMLELMVAQLDAERELPEVEAEVREAIGRTYLNLRQFGEAVRQLERVVHLRRELDPAGEQLGESLAALGSAYLNMGENSEGETVFREAMDVLQSSGGMEYDEVRFRLGELLMRQRRFDEARPMALELLETAREHRDPVLMVARLRQVAKVESNLGDHGRAEQYLMDACAVADEHLRDSHPVRVGIRNELSMLRRTLGEHESALHASTEAYEIAQRTCRPGSFDWNVCIHAHVQALVALDRREEIIRVLTDAQHALAETHGPDHRLVSETSRWLARLQDRWHDSATIE